MSVFEASHCFQDKQDRYKKGKVIFMEFETDPINEEETAKTEELEGSAEESAEETAQNVGEAEAEAPTEEKENHEYEDDDEDFDDFEYEYEEEDWEEESEE